MQSTPPLPDWIRHAHVTGYVSAHDLCPDEPRLYGTEDLYGDWNGSVLLLGKDWGPSRLLFDRVILGDEQPYRHDPDLKANVRLRQLADPFRDCGLLYGSALGNLLRDDGDVSGRLPNRAEAMAYGVEVTRFTIQRMPALQRIICLGQEAWECASRAIRLEGDWQEYRDGAKPLGRLIAAFHPSARVSNERMQAAWDLLERSLEAPIVDVATARAS
jgi:hypothetical protein